MQWNGTLTTPSDKGGLQRRATAMCDSPAYTGRGTNYPCATMTWRTAV